MSKALVSVVTQPAPLADGQTAGQFQLTVTRKDGTGTPAVQAVDAVTSAVEFDNLTAGDYTVVALRLDTTGATIGSSVSADFTVPAGATADVPASVTVQVQ